MENNIFRRQKYLDKTFKNLKEGKTFKYKENSKLVNIFVDAKFAGNYFDIVYDCSKPEITCYKNVHVLKKLEGMFDKPFSELTIQDIRELQRQLNSDELMVKAHPKAKDQTLKPMSRSYKQDLIVNIKQFWKFYMLYVKEEVDGRKIENITEYLRLRREFRENNLIKFITRDEIDLLVNSARSIQMKAFLITFFETGARISEIIALKYKNCSFDEENKRWVVRLPNTKGFSTTKMPVELDMATQRLSDWINLKDFEDEDHVFNLSYDYIRKFLRETGEKVLGRPIAPKQIRKGCAMWLLSLNANEQYVKGHMGWAASSKAIAHYINQTALKKPEDVRKQIRQSESGEILRENQELRIQKKDQDMFVENMKAQMEEMRQEQLRMFEKMQDVEVSSSRNILKSVFEEMIKKT